MSTPGTFSSLDDARKQIAYQRASARVKELKEKGAPELEALQAELERRGRIQSLLTSVPPIFNTLFPPARYKGAHGGRGSAKSWTFGKMLLKRCMDVRGTRAACIREVQRSLEQSVKRLLEDLIQLHGLGASFRVLNTHIETPGDGIIIFQGMQNHTAESIKSLEGFDLGWVEEAQSLSARSLMLLRPTLRKENSELWFTWNPRNASDPIDAFLRSDSLPPGAVVVHATYRDNPFLPEVLRSEMEWDRARDIEKYNHIWLGGYERHSEARVFKNWKEEVFETPSDAAFLFGSDFGFSPDPATLVRMFIKGRNLFIDREAYKVGCEIDHLPSLYDGLDPDNPGMARRWEIVGDSARPDTISYLQRHGYPRIVGAKKGADSVKEGVEFLKTYDIVIHPRCVRAVDEFTSYSFKTHPLTGEIIPVLEDKKNHIIDPCRYAVEKLRAPRAQKVEVW